MQCPIVVVLGNCGTGKSAFVEKSLGMASLSLSSGSKHSYSKAVTYGEITPPPYVMELIDTPGQNVTSGKLENNERIAEAFNSGSISLLLLATKAEVRLAGVAEQISNLMEQMCHFQDILGILVTHMDNPAIRWTEDEAKLMLDDEFGISTVVFTGTQHSQEHVLQQVHKVAKKNVPLDVIVNSETFSRYFRFSDQKLRVLSSINGELLGFGKKCVALSDAMRLWDQADQVAKIAFDSQKHLELETKMAQARISKLHHWDLPASTNTEALEQRGYLAHFAALCSRKLDETFSSMGLKMADFEIVRGCPHCGKAHSKDKFRSSGGCNGCTRRDAIALPDAFQFDFQTTEQQTTCFLIPPESFRREGCSKDVWWEDMLPVHLQVDDLAILEQSARSALLAQAEQRHAMFANSGGWAGKPNGSKRHGSSKWRSFTDNPVVNPVVKVITDTTGLFKGTTVSVDADVDTHTDADESPSGDESSVDADVDTHADADESPSGDSSAADAAGAPDRKTLQTVHECVDPSPQRLASSSGYPVDTRTNLAGA